MGCLNMFQNVASYTRYTQWIAVDHQFSKKNIAWAAWDFELLGLPRFFWPDLGWSILKPASELWYSCGLWEIINLKSAEQDFFPQPQSSSNLCKCMSCRKVTHVFWLMFWTCSYSLSEVYVRKQSYVQMPSSSKSSKVLPFAGAKRCSRNRTNEKWRFHRNMGNPWKFSAGPYSTWAFWNSAGRSIPRPVRCFHPGLPHWASPDSFFFLAWLRLWHRGFAWIPSTGWPLVWWFPCPCPQAQHLWRQLETAYDAMLCGWGHGEIGGSSFSFSLKKLARWNPLKCLYDPLWSHMWSQKISKFMEVRRRKWCLLISSSDFQGQVNPGFRLDSRAPKYPEDSWMWPKEIFFFLLKC